MSEYTSTATFGLVAGKINSGMSSVPAATTPDTSQPARKLREIRRSTMSTSTRGGEAPPIAAASSRSPAICTSAPPMARLAIGITKTTRPTSVSQKVP